MSQIKLRPRNIKPPKKITETYLHNAGLYYLQRFAASAAHFRRVMLRKVDNSCAAHLDQDRAACVAMVDALIEKFQRSGLLNDSGYLNASISSLRRRGLSSRAIESRLAAKGLGHNDIKSALAANAADNNQDNADLCAALRLARRKRIGPFGRADEKALAALARAGFDYETTQRVLGCSLEEAEAEINQAGIK